MPHISTMLIALVLAGAPFVSADTPLWGQCGGTNFNGSPTCVSGATCQVVNQYYSQCAPGSSSSPPSSAPASPPTTSTAVPAPTSAVKPNYWFSFGDSYTQTGFSPTGTLPNVANPFGNPNFPGYTATGGTNWVGYVTKSYNNSLLFTYNYAYGGATIDAKLVTPYQPTVLSLIDQVNQFLTTVANKPASTPWTSENSLFSIWIGINDIGNSYYKDGDRGAFSDTLLDAEFALVKKLYDAGARNFLFVNVPPIDRSPLMLAQPAASRATEKTVIAGFNSRLANRTSAFETANPGVKTWIHDSNALFSKILDAPTTYGFKDATSYGSGSNIFWGNDYHPSSYAHDYFGQEIGKKLLANTIW